MKSVNAVANRKFSRLGILSLMTVMLLGLAMGSPALAAEDFKLWHQGPGKLAGKELKHLSKSGGEMAVKWLITEPNFKKFAETWRAEPFQFVEGIKAGMLKAIETKKLDDFRKSVKEGFEKLEAKDFGGFIRRNALRDLLEKVLAMDKTKLEDEEFLEKLFEDPAIRAALGLTDKDPSEREEEPKEKGKEEEKGTSKNDKNPGALEEVTKNDGNKNAQEQQQQQQVGQQEQQQVVQDEGLTRQLEAERARNAQMQAALQALQAQRNLGTGEVDDAALQRSAQQICDRFDALQRGLFDNLNAQNDIARNALNDQFNRLAAASRVPDLGNQNRGDRLEDILPGLLANAFQQQQPQQIAPPPPPPSAVPPTASNEGNRDNGIFDQPIPQKQEQPPEEPPPPLMFPTQNRPSLTPAIALDLPTSSGGIELREAEDQLMALEARTPVATQLGPNATLPDLVMGKARVQADLRRAQAALQNAKDRASRLDEQLEALKEGGRAALPSWVKRKEAELQQNVERSKRALEGFQQQAQMAGQDPNARQALMAQFQQLQAAQNQAEEEYARFKAEVEAKVEEGSKQIKSLAKRRDQLQAVASKLEGQLGSLREEESAMQQLINNQMQMQLAAIQGANQPQQAGTPNVNRIQQTGGRTAPRTVPPSRLGVGAATSGSVPQQSNVPGAAQRGMLGVK